MTHRIILAIPVVGLGLLFSGCTTTAAKKAMDTSNPSDAYTSFDKDKQEASKHKEEKVEQVSQDMEPEKAVTILANQLASPKGPAYITAAEDQLSRWGNKQGVDKIVVSRVRPLLKDRNFETRAPALRLTIRFGDNNSNGDLIECLADEELGIRQTAFRALKSRTHRDFGYEPGTSDVARAKAVDDWRQWWQAERSSVAVQPPSVYEKKPPAEPTIVAPRQQQ